MFSKIPTESAVMTWSASSSRLSSPLTRKSSATAMVSSLLESTTSATVPRMGSNGESSRKRYSVCGPLHVKIGESTDVLRTTSQWGPYVSGREGRGRELNKNSASSFVRMFVIRRTSGGGRLRSPSEDLSEGRNTCLATSSCCRGGLWLGQPGQLSMSVSVDPTR